MLANTPTSASRRISHGTGDVPRLDDVHALVRLAL
jgi:hypothetical protein